MICFYYFPLFSTVWYLMFALRMVSRDRVRRGVGSFETPYTYLVASLDRVDSSDQATVLGFWGVHHTRALLNGCPPYGPMAVLPTVLGF